MIWSGEKTRFQKLQNEMDHDPGTLDAGLPVTDMGINKNTIGQVVTFILII